MMMNLARQCLAAFVVLGLVNATCAAEKQAAEPQPAPPAVVPMQPGAGPHPGGPMINPGKGMPFPMAGAMGATNISPEMLRKAMQARSELDELTRKTQARQAELYESNQDIKELQKQMRKLQDDIDAILAKDEELAKLRAELDSMFNAPMPMPAHPPAPAAKADEGSGKGAAAESPKKEKAATPKKTK